MAVAFYMDVHIHRAITDGLRQRNVDVLTAQDDGTATLPDPDLLSRAATLQRVFFTYDDDLLTEARSRWEKGIDFFGIAYAHPMRISIGECVRDLEMIAKAGRPSDVKNEVFYLPF